MDAAKTTTFLFNENLMFSYPVSHSTYETSKNSRRTKARNEKNCDIVLRIAIFCLKKEKLM